MAEVESISHSGIEGPDSRAIGEFYTTVLGGKCVELSSDPYQGSRGGNPHPCAIIGDYIFVIFPDRNGNPPEPGDRLRGGVARDVRHGFSVSREHFDEVVQQLRENGVAFEGPISHPERGPLGQSIYFRDVGGNFFEVCWRRDADVAYAAVPVTQG
jgi:hypothetical protein